MPPNASRWPSSPAIRRAGRPGAGWRNAGSPAPSVSGPSNSPPTAARCGTSAGRRHSRPSPASATEPGTFLTLPLARRSTLPAAARRCAVAAASVVGGCEYPDKKTPPERGQVKGGKRPSIRAGTLIRFGAPANGQYAVFHMFVRKAAAPVLLPRAARAEPYSSVTSNSPTAAMAARYRSSGSGFLFHSAIRAAQPSLTR